MGWDGEGCWGRGKKKYKGGNGLRDSMRNPFVDFTLFGI